MARGRPFPITADGAVGNAGTPITLVSVQNNKAVASGTVKLYNGSDTTGTLVGTVTTDVAQTWFYGECYFDHGLYLDLTGSGVDLTVVAE